MSFQAYLDNIEAKTGLTPRQLVDLGKERGYDDPAVKAGVIIEWLKDDYDLGRGHAMSLVHVLKNGPTVTVKRAGADGVQHEVSEELWLDGAATNPARR